MKPNINRDALTENIFSIILMAIVIMAIAIPRLVNIERPITVDELSWFSQGSDFYYALGQREFEKTVYDTHPGVTTMIAASIATHILFPEYRGLGQGYFNIKTESHDTLGILRLYEEQGVNLHQILIFSRIIMVFGIIVSTLITYYLTFKIFGIEISTLGIIFIALDPYHIGHSRLLLQEAFMSSFTMMSFFAWIYFKQNNQSRFLLLSAFGAGIAILTKITSLYLIGFIFIYEVAIIIKRKYKFNISHLISPVKWLLIIFTVIYLFWPAMWNNPIVTISEPIFLSASRWGEGPNVNFFSIEYLLNHLSVLTDFSRSLFGRTTLITWLGIFSYVVFLFTYRNYEFIKNKIFLYTSILAFPILFLILFSLVSKSTYAHYIMLAHIYIALIGGMGFGFVFTFLQLKLNRNNKYISWIFVITLLLSQISLIVREHPYYFTYRNPLISDSVGLNGYCALYDKAGEYLSSKPNSEDLVAFSWYGPGCLSFFFDGKTIPFWPKSKWSETNKDRLKQSDYLVLDEGSFHRSNLTKMMDLISNIPPEKIISFNGIDYLWIYNVMDIPLEIYLIAE